MDIAALVVSVLSVAAAVWATLYAKGQRDSAERSARAAEAAEARAAAIEQRRKYGWRIETIDLGMYALRNVGWADATHVRINSEQTVGLQGDVAEVDLAAGQAVAFVAALKPDARAMDVTITWRAAGDDAERSWVEPFSQRPPTPAEFEAHIRRRLS